jgi:hypothetical protein
MTKNKISGHLKFRHLTFVGGLDLLGNLGSLFLDCLCLGLALLGLSCRFFLDFLWGHLSLSFVLCLIIKRSQH